MEYLSRDLVNYSVIIPHRNNANLVDVEAEIKEKMSIHLVKTID